MSQHWKPPVTRIDVADNPRPSFASPEGAPSQMMRPRHRPFWAALRRHLLNTDDAIGWACVVAAGGLFAYMGAYLLIAWIAG